MGRKRENKTPSKRGNPKGGSVVKGGKNLFPQQIEEKVYSSKYPFVFSKEEKEPIKNSGFRFKSNNSGSSAKKQYKSKPQILPNDDLYLLLKNADSKLKTFKSPIPSKDWTFNSNIQFLKILKAYHPEAIERDEKVNGKEIRYFASEIILEVLIRAPDNHTFMSWFNYLNTEISREFTSSTDIEMYLKYHDKGKIVSDLADFDILISDLKHAATVYFFSGKINYQKWYDITMIFDRNHNIPILFSLSELLSIENFSVQNYIESGIDYLVYKDFENIESILSYKDNYESIKELLLKNEKSTSKLLIEYWLDIEDKKGKEELKGLLPEWFNENTDTEKDKEKESSKEKGVEEEKKELITPEISGSLKGSNKTSLNIYEEGEGKDFQDSYLEGIKTKKVAKIDDSVGEEFFFTDFLDDPNRFNELSLVDFQVILGLKELIPPLSNFMYRYDAEDIKSFFSQIDVSFQQLLSPWITSGWGKLISSDFEGGLQELQFLYKISPDFFKKYSLTFNSYLEINKINSSDIANKLFDYKEQGLEDQDTYEVLNILYASCIKEKKRYFTAFDFMEHTLKRSLGVLSQEEAFIAASSSVFMPSIVYFFSRRNTLEKILDLSPMFSNNLCLHWNILAFQHIMSGEEELVALGVQEMKCLSKLKPVFFNNIINVVSRIVPYIPEDKRDFVRQYFYNNSKASILQIYIYAFSKIKFKSNKFDYLDYNKKAIRGENIELSKASDRSSSNIVNDFAPAKVVSNVDLTEELVRRLYFSSFFMSSENAEENLKFLRENFANIVNKLEEAKSSVKKKTKVKVSKERVEERGVQEEKVTLSVKRKEEEKVSKERIEIKKEERPEEGKLGASLNITDKVAEGANKSLEEGFIKEDTKKVTIEKPLTYNKTTDLLKAKPDRWPTKQEKEKKRVIVQKKPMPKELYDNALFFTDFLGYPVSFEIFMGKNLEKTRICNELVPELRDFYEQKEDLIDLFSYKSNQRYNFLLLPYLDRALKKVLNGDLKEGIKELAIIIEISKDFASSYISNVLRQKPKTEEEKEKLQDRLSLSILAKDLTDEEREALELCRIAIKIRPKPNKRFLFSDYIGKTSTYKVLNKEEKKEILDRIGLEPPINETEKDIIDICETLDDIAEGEKLLIHWHSNAVSDFLAGDIELGLQKIRELMNIDSDFSIKNIPIYRLVINRQEEVVKAISDYREQHPDSADILSMYISPISFSAEKDISLSGVIPYSMKQETGRGEQTDISSKIIKEVGGRKDLKAKEDTSYFIASLYKEHKDKVR